MQHHSIMIEYYKLCVYNFASLNCPLSFENWFEIKNSKLINKLHPSMVAFGTIPLA